MAIFPKPRYSTVSVKKKEDIPKDLFVRCPLSKDIVYVRELEKNLNVVPGSGYHFPLDAPKRIHSLLDEGSFVEEDASMTPGDPLEFTDSKPYAERIEQATSKTGLKESVVSGTGTMDAVPVSIAVMDFRYIGASMGSVAGEKITRAIERATERKCPVIVVSASGGARMQEGIFSLMQMAKTSAALKRHSEAGLPYFSILTNPTTGGVTASFAVLGDVNIAEPGALIGFAGPRVIKETIKKDLPEGFQRSEFLLSHGLIDQIVPRSELRKRLITLIHQLHTRKARVA